MEAKEDSCPPKVIKEIESLKVAFNSLNEELSELKSRCLALEDVLSSLRSYIDSLHRYLEKQIISAKSYAMAVSKIESRLVHGVEH